MRLTSPSSGNVVVSVSSDNETEGTVSPSTLTFNSGNWRSEQLVRVVGQDDNVSDGNSGFRIILDNSSSTTASEYVGLNPADVMLSNIDDESPGFVVSSVSGSVTEEGGEAVFTVRLTSEPSGNVVVSVSSDNVSEGTVSPSSLTFNSGNWRSEQLVRVVGQDDNVSDGNSAFRIILDNSTSTTASEYVGLNPADVMLSNIDDESPGFVVSSVSGSVTEEGGEAVFTVRLDEPSFFRKCSGIGEFR